MWSVEKMEENIAIVLLFGTLLSAFLVLVGGVIYLFQYGNDPMQSELVITNMTPTNIKSIWAFALSFSPLGIIELGLLLLVATQTLRVALLCGFYAAMRDYRFFFISAFILAVLIYSSFWRR